MNAPSAETYSTPLIGSVIGYPEIGPSKYNMTKFNSFVFIIWLQKKTSSCGDMEGWVIAHPPYNEKSFTKIGTKRKIKIYS